MGRQNQDPTLQQSAPTTADGTNRPRVWGAIFIGDAAKNKPWVRRIVYNLLPICGVASAVVVIPLPALQAFFESQTGTWIRWVLLALIAVLTYAGHAYRDYIEVQKRRKEVEYADGFEQALAQWQSSAVHTAGASKQVWRQLDHLLSSMRVHVEGAIEIPADLSAEAAIKTCLGALRAGVASHFKLPVDAVNVNLMLLHREPGSRNSLKLVQIAVESHGRAPGNGSGYRIASSNPAPGAPTAYVKKEPQYIHDAHKLQHPNFKNKPYRAIMSWPVMSGQDSEVLAIINIDSPKSAAFGALNEEEKRTMSFTLCGVILRQVGLALLDRRAFRASCNRGFIEEVA